MRPADGKHSGAVRALQTNNSHTRQKAIRAAVIGGTLEEAPDYALARFLAHGNPRHTGASVLGLTQIYLDLVGEAFILIKRDALATPREMWPVSSHWVKEIPTARKPTFRISFGTWQEEVPANDMLWLSHPNPVDPFGRSSGVARALADELETDTYAAAFAKQFFLNSARPDVIVSPATTGPMDTGLTRSEVERLEENWVREHQGAQRHHKPMFIARGVNVEQIRNDLRGIELTALRDRAAKLVAETYAIPPESLGRLENSNRSTVVSANFLFQSNVIVPRLEFLRAFFQARLVPMFDESLVVTYDSPVEEDHEFVLSVMKSSPHSFGKTRISARKTDPAQTVVRIFDPIPRNGLVYRFDELATIGLFPVCPQPLCFITARGHRIAGGMGRGLIPSRPGLTVGAPGWMLHRVHRSQSSCHDLVRKRYPIPMSGPRSPVCATVYSGSVFHAQMRD